MSFIAVSAVVKRRKWLVRVYEDDSYRERADYANACHPPLSNPDEAWAVELIWAVERGKE